MKNQFLSFSSDDGKDQTSFIKTPELLLNQGKETQAEGEILFYWHSKNPNQVLNAQQQDKKMLQYLWSTMLSPNHNQKVAGES